MKARAAILALFSLVATYAQAPQPPSLGQAPAAAGQPPTPILMPPIPPSPIEEFRNWLRMSEAERENALAQYSEEKRVVLRQKIQLYSAMPADQRERRLKMLELRWYMRPLMGVPQEQRGNYREMIPPRLHDLIIARLEQWDRLDEQTRKEILANDQAREMTTRYFVNLRRAPAPPTPELAPFNGTKQSELQESLRTWQETSPAQRQRMAEQLSAFFELPRPAQEKTLVEFSEKDREEIQKALNAFSNLSAEHRRICVESFQKFATMSPAERREFLLKAERWQQMSLQERETWRNLVTKLPPMPQEPVEMPPKPQAVLFHGRNLAATGTEAPTPSR